MQRLSPGHSPAIRRTWTPASVILALFLPTILVSTPSPADAFELNGFLPPPGKGAVAISYIDESYDEFWRGKTRVSNPGLGEVSTHCVAAWMTWGLTTKLALVVNVAGMDITTTGTEGFEDDGIQDLTALAKYRAAEWGSGAARHSLTVAGGVRVPLSDYEADAPVSVGDGTTDGLARLVYQLEVGRFYVSQQVGFDLRGGDAPDGVPLHTELGYTVGRVTLGGFYTDYHATGGTDIGDPGFTFPSNRDEYQRIGAKVYGRVTPQLGLVAVGYTTIDGRNSGDITGLSVGLNVSF